MIENNKAVLEKANAAVSGGDNEGFLSQGQNRNHHFILPGNITTSFSNEGVYFPNGDETQRKGIIPDITVLPTIEGIRLGKDEAFI